jgi:hypothetical protein
MRFSCRLIKATIRTHTFRIWNNYCFCTATLLTRTPFYVRLYVHCVSCFATFQAGNAISKVETKGCVQFALQYHLYLKTESHSFRSFLPAILLVYANYYYYYYYLFIYLLTYCNWVFTQWQAVVLTLVQTEQIRINIHKRNNTKTQYKTL